MDFAASTFDKRIILNTTYWHFIKIEHNSFAKLVDQVQFRRELKLFSATNGVVLHAAWQQLSMIEVQLKGSQNWKSFLIHYLIVFRFFCMLHVDGFHSELAATVISVDSSPGMDTFQNRFCDKCFI